MQDAETRALRRAAVLLLAVSAARLATGRLGVDHPPDDESVLPALSEAVGQAADEAQRRATPLADGEQVDPNRASAVELDRLPGVGPATADAIVAARDAGLVFRRPEDLEAVRGIGPALSSRMAPLLDLRSPPPIGGSRRGPRGRGETTVRSGYDDSVPVDLNRASSAELQRLPGVGPALAERIVERRRRRPFGSVDELVDVRGIGPATVERIRPNATIRRRP